LHPRDRGTKLESGTTHGGRSPPYYVRSKHASPDWIADIRREQLKLLVIGPERGKIENPSGRWLVEREPTFRALEVIRMVGDLKRKKKENIRRKHSHPIDTILISEKGDVVARIAGQCITGKTYKKIEGVGRVGWSSAIFASIIKSKILEIDLEPRKIIYDALSVAHSTAVSRTSAATYPAISGDPIGSFPVGKWEELENTWLGNESFVIQGFVHCHARFEIWKFYWRIPLIGIDWH